MCAPLFWRGPVIGLFVFLILLTGCESLDLGDRRFGRSQFEPMSGTQPAGERLTEQIRHDWRLLSSSLHSPRPLRSIPHRILENRGGVYYALLRQQSGLDVEEAEYAYWNSESQKYYVNVRRSENRVDPQTANLWYGPFPLPFDPERAGGWHDRTEPDGSGNPATDTLF